MSYEKCQVNTICKEICHALVNLAKDHGWAGTIFDSPTYPDTFLFLCFNNYNERTMGGNGYIREDRGKEITIEEAIKIITTPLPKEKLMSFTINGESVLVMEDCVKIGCCVVDKSKVGSIYETMMSFE